MFVQAELEGDSMNGEYSRLLTASILFSLHLQKLELPGGCAPGLEMQQTRTSRNTMSTN